MRIEGTLVKWDDERGFGFIQPVEGGADVFVHVTAFPFGTGRPDVGEQVSFDIESGEKGPRAARVMSLRTIRLVTDLLEEEPRRRAPSMLELALIPAFAGALIFLSVKYDLARVALAGYVVASLIAYFLFLHDKLTAQAGGWRVGEGTLLFWSYLGGWPGGLLAQHLLSHKTRKMSFRVPFWIVVVANLISLGFLLWAQL